MIGKKSIPQATLFIPGNIRDYIPDDHVLVRVNKILDLQWVEDAVRDQYCTNNGRPSIAPEAALRLMLAGFFLGIVHDRKLMREAQVNMAIRWFSGFSLADKIPDHSSLTRIRNRWGEKLFKELFDNIVQQCIAAGLVGGETVHIDASLIRADVSWESLSRDHAEKVIEENKETEALMQPDCDNGEEDGVQMSSNKKPGRPRTREKKAKRKSKTDPDASLSTNCQTKAMIPCFKQHTAVDDQIGVVVDIDVQTGEDSESKRLHEVVARIEERIETKIEAVTCDAGYASGENYKFCEARKTEAIIPPQKVGRRKKDEKMPLRRFKFDELKRIITCPAKKILKPCKTDQKGTMYRARTCDCKNCDLRKRCFGKSGKSRTILIPNGHTSLLRARRKKERGWDKESKRIYGRHSYQVEGVHGEAKSCHGLARAVRRGRGQVLVQALMTAATINLKRLAKSAEDGDRLAAEATASVLVTIGRFPCQYFALRTFFRYFWRILKFQENISAARNYFPTAI